MSKNKLQKFAENLTFSNLIQPSLSEAINGFYLKGNWAEQFFQNHNPITLELGCGKGEYTTGLAEKYPDRNFIGVDIKGARLWKGASYATENKLKNVAFLRTHIDHIAHFFSASEISEIWITFPDPQPGKSRKRLTSNIFIEKYRKILSDPSLIHLKTDSRLLFDFTIEEIEKYGYKMHFCTYNLYHESISDESSEIQTFYEKMFLEQNMPINYLRFSLSK